MNIESLQENANEHGACKICLKLFNQKKETGKQIGERHQHTIKCAGCNASHNCDMIYSLHNWFPNEMVSLPAGWFSGVDGDTRDELALCSEECFEKFIERNNV